ncbi:MAG: UPF0236 family protein [Candidatus Aminicenantes bacterium]|nr:UPF0236 family protein [Candidatus Aminicenantes bacterium]
MDELEIKIVLAYKVPEKGLTLNGILRGLEEDKNILMQSMVKAILHALEEKAVEEQITREPGRYIRYGRRKRGRMFRTSFGPVRYRLAQIYDKKGTVYCPLLRKLDVTPYKQYQEESLEAAVGQAIHLSYRLASKGVRRIKGSAPGKSTLYRRVQELAEKHGEWPFLKHRRFKFLMADGTKVKLQEGRDSSVGQRAMRWAFACEDVGKRFEPVGFWVDKDWASIRQDLEKRLDYGKLEVLLSDGEPGIEENLLSCGMRKQRCIWHGKRDFPFLLYQDGLKKQEQQPLRKLMEEILLFSFTKELLEEVLEPEKELVAELVEEIKKGFEKLIKVLSPEKYPKARAYMENFYHNALLVFDFWLEGKGWIPLTTNAIESAFSRLVNRIKRIGRRWSEQGLTNWLAIAMRKIFVPSLWDKLWTDYLRINKQLTLSRLKVEYVWI